MIVWEFKINGVEIEEPVSWDAAEINIQRSDNFHGLENIYTDNIKFWGLGAELIKEAFETSGIDAELNFIVNYSCDGGITFTNFLTGILNAYFYNITNNEVSIKLEPSLFQRKVKNRLSTPINLMSNVSIGGQPMTNINPFDLGLHSKSIQEQSQVKTNEALLGFDDSHIFPFNTPKFTRIEFPLQIDISELSTVNETSSIFNFEAPGLNIDSGTPILLIKESGENINVSYKIKGSLVHFCPDDTEFTFTLAYGYGANMTVNYFQLQNATYTNIGGTTQTITFDYAGSFNVPAVLNNGIWINITLSNYRNFNSTPNDSLFTLNTDQICKVSFTQDTIYNPSKCQAFLVYEFLNKLVEAITDETNSFRSEFFGRTNSIPNSYPDNGCGAWLALTNGKNIRRMLDKGGNYFPIVTTLSEAFEALDAVYNLGLKIETDTSGKSYVRIEQKSYFYNSSAVKTFSFISDLNVYPAVDLIFNNYKVGYEKWNLQITGSNAIDEFNASHNYTIPVVKADKTLITISKYVSSGYLIEQTRRVQYQTNPSSDFETDDNIFLICTNRGTIISDLYTIPPTSTSYPAGTVSERNENFISVSNVLSPSTCYNLRISPVRMALNWYNYISASIYKTASAAIKFVSGLGNFQEQDEIYGDCSLSDSVLQNQDLLASQITNTNPIFFPEILEFSYPLSYNDFIDIMSNSEKAIQISCSNSDYSLGYIKSLKYRPNAEGGIASFTLLRGQCIQGDFNSDFSADFSIGNC